MKFHKVLMALMLLGSTTLLAQELPVITNDDGFSPTYGEQVTLEGFYDVDRVASGKRFQGSWLILDDGSKLLLSYRPQPQYLAWIERRVQVTGRPYTPGYNTQHVSADHFELESMALLEGETARDPAPSAVPAPPRATNPAELEARVGRWVEIYGVLSDVAEEDTYFVQGRVTLADGTVVKVHGAKSQWTEHDGKAVTVTAKLVHGDGDFDLAFSNAVCPGDVPECGVSRPSQRKGKKQLLKKQP